MGLIAQLVIQLGVASGGVGEDLVPLGPTQNVIDRFGFGFAQQVEQRQIDSAKSHDCQTLSSVGHRGIVEHVPNGSDV